MGSSRRGRRGDVPKDLLSGQRRTLGSRIPQALWTVAARLAKRHGIARTSSVLRLDYYRLKTRVEAAQGREPAGAHEPAAKVSRRAFVELPAPVMAGPQCLLELDNGTGATLRLQLTGYEADDVVHLAHDLWTGE